MSAIVSDREPVSVTPTAFRTALGCFATGVTLITLQQEGEVHAMTANAFTSVSLEPPLVLVCIDCRSRTHREMHSQQRFGINVLAEHQQPISQHYALPVTVRRAKALSDVEFRVTESGTPLLNGSLASLECRVREMYRGGDHTIFLSEVERIAIGEGEPLLYFRSNYRTICVDPAQPAHQTPPAPQETQTPN